MPRFSPDRKLTRWAFGLLLALVSLEVLLPTGCLGVEAVVGRRTAESLREAYLTPERPRAGGVALTTNPEWRSAVRVQSSADVLRLWGPPDRRRVTEGRERWIYRTNGLKWRGVWLWAVLIPIPLQIPVGHNKVRLEFAHDTLYHVTVQGQGSKFYGLTVLGGAVFGKELKLNVQ